MWTPPFLFGFAALYVEPPQPKGKGKGIQAETDHRSNISMGNHKFKLSDMMPNSWLYKLKEMSIRRRNHKKLDPPNFNSSISPTDHPHPILSHSHPRKSHHFARELPAGNSPADPPRKSSRGKPRRKAASVNAAARTSPRLTVTNSTTSGCICSRTPVESDQSVTAGPPLSTQYAFHTEDDAKNNPIIFEKGQKTSAQKTNGSDEELKPLDLPPIITRSPEEAADAADGSTCPSVTITREPRISSSPSRRFPVNSPGPKLRIMNSPRVSSKRFSHVGRRKSGSTSSSAAAAKRSLTDSLAIVKSTNDPQRDFMESMVEMIVENRISASSELEDLLACYLSLNTDEYHDIIIKVFKQIWFDMTDIGLH